MLTNLEVRLYENYDKYSLYTLINEAHSKWTEEILGASMDELNNSKKFPCFVAIINGCVVGYEMEHVRGGELGTELYTRDIFVSKPYRGNNLGEELTKYAILYAQKIGVTRMLRVHHPTNLFAIKISTKLGFEQINWMNYVKNL